MVKPKRNKSYRPKPCVLPLGMRKAIDFELPGYQASIALGQPHFCESHLYDLLSCADMTRRIAPLDGAIATVAQAMIVAIRDVQVRAERVGKLGVSGDEMRVLRDGLARCMEYLRHVPNTAIDRAGRAALAEFNKLGALRV